MVHQIDISRLQRCKPNMELPVDTRTEDEKVFATMHSMLHEKYPRYTSGICCDKIDDHWNKRSFKDKVDTLYFDTVFWM